LRKVKPFGAGAPHSGSRSESTCGPASRQE
jgi:hypothetical protein